MGSTSSLTRQTARIAVLCALIGVPVSKLQAQPVNHTEVKQSSYDTEDSLVKELGKGVVTLISTCAGIATVFGCWGNGPPKRKGPRFDQNLG